MSKYGTWWYGKWEGFTTWFSGIEWTALKSKLRSGKPGYNLSEQDWETIKQHLADGYYIILTRRKTHLTTYSIMLMDWIKTGRVPEYAHALMNLDLVDAPDAFEQFKLMEATSKGVHYSPFHAVFDCDYVCLLQPLNVNASEWDAVMSGLATQLGKQYDNLFDIKDNSRVSCVEMVLDSLRASPNYEQDFKNLELMMEIVGNLTPQMLRDCPDFKVVLEIKR